MELRCNRFIKCITIIITILLFIFAYYKLFIIREVVNILLIAFILSYVLKPIYKTLCNKIKIKKDIVAIILLLCIFLSIFLMVISITPKILSQDISSSFQNIINEINNNELLEKFNITDQFKNKLIDKINKSVEIYSIKLLSIANRLSKNLISIIIIPIVCYYFLAHGEYLIDKMMLVFPADRRQLIKKFGIDIDKVLSRYVISQISLSIIVGIMTFLALIFLKVKFALILSIINGVFNIIPYFGPILGVIPALIIALMDSPLKFLLTIIALGAIQQIEGNFIAPQITASSTEMHPLVIIILLILGEKLGGLIGMILIIPIVVIIKVIYDDLDYYLF